MQDALNYINCLRSSHGAESLTWDLDLGRTAQEYANSCPQQSSDADVPADKRTYIENLVRGFGTRLELAYHVVHRGWCISCKLIMLQLHACLSLIL